MTQIRGAVPDDADAVRALWEAVAAESEWIGTELPLRADWSQRFRSAVSSGDAAWMIADDDSAGVGAINVQNAGGLAVVGMAIVSSHRGRGIGRALLVRGIDWARERRCHKVILEVWPHNVRARALYSSAGFEEEGYLRRQYRRKSGALWDAITMGLVLDEESPGRP